MIEPTLAYDEISDCDLVIEAVFEEMAVKQAVFRQLDATLRAGAILASNTSTLDLDAIAAVTGRPQDVIGLHFFSPAQVMKLLEIVRGEKTAPDVLMSALKFARQIGKTAVVAGVCDGFIGNRMLEQYLRQAMFMLEEGASPRQIDQAIENFGFAMGPFRMNDLAGNDISWAIRKRRSVEKPHIVYSEVADRLCEQGRFGQKTGAGWYRYEAGDRRAIVDPAVDALIEQHRQSIGATTRALGDDEIIHRLLFALCNEGAKILDEGIALRASDIDLAYLSGYGFPAYRGGPMLYADEYGLPQVIERMNAFARTGFGRSGLLDTSTVIATTGRCRPVFHRPCGSGLMRPAQLFDLTGRTAIVTGGSRGLGLQIATALGEAGAQVLIAARKAEELDAAHAQLSALGVKAHALQADFGQAEAIETFAQSALQTLHRVDILVNNAGAAWGAPAEEHPLEAWQKLVNLNLTGLFLTCQQIARRSMIPNRYGRILNIASIAGLRGNPPGTNKTIAYNTSKGGVVNFTRALAG